MKLLRFFLLASLLIISAISCKNRESKSSTKEDLIDVKENTKTQNDSQLGGLALYTVRDAMDEDVKSTLKAVAEIGYQNIEAAGYKEGKYYDMTPEDFKMYLQELNLTPISTHQSSVTLENAEIEMAAAKAAGFEYFVVPIPPMGLFNYDNTTNTMSMSGGAENLANILNKLGKKASDAELKLLYHNHDFEFVEDEEGIVPIVYLLENCDPKYVNFQMDLFWVTKAGADPIAYFEKYPGRFKIWHVKDMNEQGKFAPVGKGTIDFAKILASKEKSGMKYYMVEQDMTFTMEPLEAIQVSHDALKTIGFD
ncbi:sugar phosphate isomerase/epimerase family protein [Croceitalea rosinachiae]|uniref:Sugar phosphate isomerase/epimerase n=1 Tax=Croceitalea rosinachiae TaxID=3075596 RepID=A0ABU3A5X1_9FLAO|nr:sugar phosphate isomerase/epimerase [Croceitalea sp. F388]MDT0605558.1 sugar phosphate isomerase/epimerase [Croceitalea sp. F388]